MAGVPPVLLLLGILVLFSNTLFQFYAHLPYYHDWSDFLYQIGNANSLPDPSKNTNINN